MQISKAVGVFFRPGAGPPLGLKRTGKRARACYSGGGSTLIVENGECLFFSGFSASRFQIRGVQTEADGHLLDYVAFEFLPFVRASRVTFDGPSD